MPSRGASRGGDMRRRVALEAARLISEQGIRDFHQAKRKAAAHLNAPSDSVLPKNREIEDALRERQRLFQSDKQPQLLRHLRESALEAMRFFECFEARLVGAVLDGTADQHSAVCLHLFSDTTERVMQYLDDHAIAYRELDHRQRLRHAVYAQFPALVIERHDATFDLTILPLDAIRQAPVDRSHEHPMRRANPIEVERLLVSTAAED